MNPWTAEEDVRTAHPAGLVAVLPGIYIRIILMESVSLKRLMPSIWNSTVRAGILCEVLL